jgi:phospholipid/cholesterol/gamma-HCH transport system substrate-binding protein
MAGKAQKIKVGVFVLASVALLWGLLAAFLGLGASKGTRYHVLTDDAGGLEVRSAVLFRGVRVGRVADLEISDAVPEGVKVTLEIAEDVRINADARAYFEMAGVTGQKVVNIRGGKPDTPPLPPGSRLELGHTALERLGQQSEILLTRASKLLDSTDQLVATLNRSASKLSPERIDETLLETQKLVRNLGRTADEMNRTVAETRGPLLRTLSTAEGTLKEVDRLGRRSDAVLQNLDSTITDLRGVVRANDDDLRTTFENLRQASQSFKALSHDLRRRPNLLLFGGAAPERKLP